LTELGDVDQMIAGEAAEGLAIGNFLLQHKILG